MASKTGAKEIARRAPELKSLPESYQRISDAIDRTDSSSEMIAAVVCEDAGIASRVLRLVNSAFFGFPGKIDTVSHAISLVGTEQLRDLALATCVIRMFEGIPSQHVSMRSFWGHSIACGIGARILALRCREENVERHFVAGLLHDVGSMVIYTQEPRKSARLLKRCAKSHELMHKAEHAIFGFDHADVGGELVAAWRLPNALGEPIRCHHAPDRATLFPVETAVVHMADVLAGALSEDGSGERLVPPISEQAWSRLGIKEDTLPEIVTEMDNQIESVCVALLGDTSD